MMNDLQLLALQISLLNLKMSLDLALGGISQAEQPMTLNADCNASSDIAQDTAEKVEALV